MGVEAAPKGYAIFAIAENNDSSSAVFESERTARSRPDRTDATQVAWGRLDGRPVAPTRTRFDRICAAGCADEN